MDWLIWGAAVVLILAIGWFMLRPRKSVAEVMVSEPLVSGGPGTPLTDTPQDERTPPSG